MAEPVRRSVVVDRTPDGRLVVSNPRGGRVELGNGQSETFTPTELLLAAIGGCTAMDVDALTSRRAEPDSFAVDVHATKISDADGNRITDVEVTFRISFPDGEKGDAARAALPTAVKRSHDRLCTVGRTVEIATPVATRIA